MEDRTARRKASSFSSPLVKIKTGAVLVVNVFGGINEAIMVLLLVLLVMSRNAILGFKGSKVVGLLMCSDENS